MQQGGGVVVELDDALTYDEDFVDERARFLAAVIRFATHYLVEHELDGRELDVWLVQLAAKALVYEELSRQQARAAHPRVHALSQRLPQATAARGCLRASAAQ
jgi:hypothetical protein